MTPEINKAIISKWIDAWIRNEPNRLDELFAHDYTVNGMTVGIDGVKQAVQFLHSVLSGISADLHEMVSEDDKVVIRWTIRGRHAGHFMGVPPTGKKLELSGINIYQIVDNKIFANYEQTDISEVIQRLQADHGKGESA